jgi:hypothetical protein
LKTADTKTGNDCLIAGAFFLQTSFLMSLESLPEYHGKQQGCTDQMISKPKR